VHTELAELASMRKKLEEAARSGAEQWRAMLEAERW